MKRDIESEVAEWLDLAIDRQSGGGLGYPSSYDFKKFVSAGKPGSRQPMDFPKRLLVCDAAIRVLDCKLIGALSAKYLLLDAADSMRAAYLGVSESQYYRRVTAALDMLKLADPIAENIMAHKNRDLV